MKCTRELVVYKVRNSRPCTCQPSPIDTYLQTNPPLCICNIENPKQNAFMQKIGVAFQKPGPWSSPGQAQNRIITLPRPYNPQAPPRLPKPRERPCSSRSYHFLTLFQIPFKPCRRDGRRRPMRSKRHHKPL